MEVNTITIILVKVVLVLLLKCTNLTGKNSTAYNHHEKFASTGLEVLHFPTCNYHYM